MTVRTGFVVFESLDGKYKSECLMGDGPATPTGGYGGWELKPRPRRQSLTQWNGIDPLQIDIAILFDDLVNNRSVEGPIQKLEQMGGVGIGGGEPPLITVDSGGLIPYDFHANKNRVWVISNIQWGDVERNVFGNRIRQAAVVTITQYIEDDELRNESSAQKRKGKKKPKSKRGRELRGSKKKIYVVKPGDTLSSIAARKLGSHKRWREIARLNGIRDGARLRPGESLRLP